MNKTMKEVIPSREWKIEKSNESPNRWEVVYRYNQDDDWRFHEYTIFKITALYSLLCAQYIKND